MRRHRTPALILAATLTSCAPAPRPPAIVATANPYATETAIAILKKGGSAIDAAIAAQMTLTLVEPQSSGIGGGGFLLHWDESAQRLTSYDGRETAPRAINERLFLQENGEPLPFLDAMVGGISTGAPGIIALLHKAHENHGRLPWKTLFEPAIQLADEGFQTPPRLHAMLSRDPVLPERPPSRRLYYRMSADGKMRAPQKGETLKNPELARTLRALAEKGARAFYEGAIARDIIKTVQTAPHRAGSLALSDLAAYKAKIRDNLCRPYRAYRICAMPPPSSGGATLLQILGILETFNISALAPQSLEALHLISEASRLAYADRARYLADPDFVSVPLQQLLSPEYLKSRARLISKTQALPKATAGDISTAEKFQDQKESALPSTTHMSILDDQGNAVSFTSSIEGPFGSHLMSGGFFLNNQLTDFAFEPRQNDGRLVANAPAPEKRPLSSMTPTLIFDERGEFFAALGSPGGSRIIAYVAQSVIALIDWNMTMREAFALPRHVARGEALELEKGTPIADLQAALQNMGHEVIITDLTSGLHGIRVIEGEADGGADPRRDGSVAILR